MSVGCLIIANGKSIVDLLDSLHNNSCRPDCVVVVNNTGTKIENSRSYVSVCDSVDDKVMGLGVGWQLGFDKLCDLDFVYIFDCSITLNSELFECVIDASEREKNGGVFCPVVVDSIDEVVGVKSSRLKIMNRREGCVYAVRREVFVKIPMPPNLLDVSCSCDWLWYWSIRLGYKWISLMDSFVFCNRVTLQKGESCFRQSKKERSLLYELIEKCENFF